MPVIVSDDLFGEFRHAADRNLGKIETGLLIYIIGPVKCGALVAGIGGDDGESARQSRVVPGGGTSGCGGCGTSAGS